jgi:hypothetical protein
MGAEMAGDFDGTDRDFLEPLTAILDARGGFGHREHLELAWTYLALSPLDAARRQMSAAVRHVAGMHGAPDRYHETITNSWVLLVETHRRHDTAATFDEFIGRHPGLLDRQLLSRHYSAAVLGSAKARAQWTSPDLRPLPTTA